MKTSVRRWQGHSGIILSSVNSSDVIDCTVCGFRHIVPIPSLKDMEGQYEEDFYSNEKPGYIEKREQDSEWWNLHYNRMYDFLERNVTKGRILSIGCGPGFFLQYGKKRGWHTLGVEPGRGAVEYLRRKGIDVIQGFFEEVDLSEYERFDVIHAAEVLEHVARPELLVRCAYDNLRDNGIICLVVANEYNRLQTLLTEKMGLKPWWVVPKEHINYFDIESASRLLRNNGFEVIHKEVTFPMELFLLMGQHYVGNSEVGRRCHAMRKELELNLWREGMGGFLERLYRFFMEEGMGRELIIYGRKS